MTIQEALGRNPLRHTPRERQVGEYDLTRVLDNYGDEMLRSQFRIGAGVLIEASIPEMFNELAEIIKPDFPDVTTDREVIYSKTRSRPERDRSSSLHYPAFMDDRFEYWGDGTVSMSIGWDFPKTSNSDRRYKSIEVIALPKNMSLLITITSTLDPHKTSGVLIPYRIWKNPWNKERGRKIVEDEIVQAYRNPITRPSYPPSE